MIKIENVEITGWEAALRGCRNPMNSHDKSDSAIRHGDQYWGIANGNSADFEDFVAEEIAKGHLYDDIFIGPNDHKLMMSLAKAGSTDAKYRRMINVTADVTAPLYWWKEYDTYKVSTVANSCSTMHKIHSKEFTLDDFSHEHLTRYTHNGELCRDWLESLEATIDDLNAARILFLETKDKQYWWQMIQLLPSSYNQRRTIQLNYEVLAAIYPKRKDHKLDCWHTFCDWIRSLPYSELITLEEMN